jgi:DNA-directed RNA polymerase subunit RPC12/RpoP
MDMAAVITEAIETRCPSCDSEALYRYGRIKTGTQRFMCLVCHKQFSLGAKKMQVKGKPACPGCGKPMNVYMIEGDVIRFRCSGYPVCRTFRKFTMKEEK